MISFVVEGVVSVGDIDKVMVYGFGLCWVVMGLNVLFYLGGGFVGICGFCEYFGGLF